LNDAFDLIGCTWLQSCLRNGANCYLIGDWLVSGNKVALVATPAIHQLGSRAVLIIRVRSAYHKVIAGRNCSVVLA
jgi:hypothetical protein